MDNLHPVFRNILSAYAPRVDYCDCPHPMPSRSPACDFCGEVVKAPQCCGEEMQSVAALRGSAFVFEGWRCNNCSTERKAE